MANIKFTIQGIVKFLPEFKPGKSAGPDEIPTWILKEYAMLIAPILKVIYTLSYQTGILLLILSLFIKKETKAFLQTTGQYL